MLADAGTIAAIMEVSQIHGPAPFTVGFSDNSTGTGTGWQWNFGDGTANATENGTMHTFQAPGTYTVILTVTDGLQNNSTSTQITVDPSLFAGFASNTINESSLQDIQFYDTSAGEPTSWHWDFGDGTPNATDANPSHMYQSPGTYTVTLTVTGSLQSNSTSQQVVVATGPVPTLSPGSPPTATPTPALPASIVALVVIAAAGLASIAGRQRKK